MRHTLTLPLVGSVVLLSWVHAVPVRAQQASTEVAAQALFEEGKRLMSEGKYREACAKLADSERLDPGAGTLLNLAACYEKNAQTASAWSTYVEAVTLAQ